MHEFEQIEDAAIAALTPLLDVGLRTLETYNGQVEAEDIAEITAQFPCIYVLAASLAGQAVNQATRYELTLTLIVGDRHPRGPRLAARGDATGPGIYELLRLARNRLHGTAPLRRWGAWVLSDERPLVYAPRLQLCLYQAVYTIKHAN